MTTLQEIRQFLAREVGPFQPGTATGASTAGLLVSTSYPIKSNIPQSSKFKDHLIFRPSASADDQVRVVSSYDPATGQLTPDLPWASAPGNGEAFELLGTIDPLELHDAINDALKEILVTTEFTLSPVKDDNRTFAPTVREPAWVRQVGYLDVNEDRNRVDPYRGGRTIRGDAMRLNGQVVLYHEGHTFDPARTTLYVKAMARAYERCAPAAGSFGDQAGLVLDTDTVEVDRTWVAATALVELWRRHSQILEAGANQRLIRNRVEAVAWKTDLSDELLDVPPLTFVTMVQHWGPLPTAGGYGLGV